MSRDLFRTLMGALAVLSWAMPSTASADTTITVDVPISPSPAKLPPVTNVKLRVDFGSDPSSDTFTVDNMLGGGPQAATIGGVLEFTNSTVHDSVAVTKTTRPNELQFSIQSYS